MSDREHKLALWQLWRAGYRIANFIHDEVLIEMPADTNLVHQAEIVRQLMISAMHEVVPDVRVDVQYALSARWAKDAEVYFDEAGRLGVWREGKSVLGLMSCTWTMRWGRWRCRDRTELRFT